MQPERGELMGDRMAILDPPPGLTVQEVEAYRSPIDTRFAAIYYPWVHLGPIPWLKWFVLINPLVYMSEGFRLSLTRGIPHMPVAAIYAALIGFTVLLTLVGIQGFRKRVLS